MQSSQTVSELFKALSKFQAEVSGVKKGSDNPFFKSKYADLAAVVEAIKKPLADNGLCFTQLPSVSEDKKLLRLETVLGHVSGEWVSSTLDMIPDKPTPQAVGSCITYARRYSLMAILGLPAEDDDGNEASKPAPKNIKQSSNGAMDRKDFELIGRAKKFCATSKENSAHFMKNVCKGTRIIDMSEEGKLYVSDFLEKQGF